MFSPYAINLSAARCGFWSLVSLPCHGRSLLLLQIVSQVKNNGLEFPLSNTALPFPLGDIFE
jgi:hypothetical protein